MLRLLEKDLAEFIDVDITREDAYHIKIGGRTAVSFGTNVHLVSLSEIYTPQQDMYTKLNSDGVTATPYESNLIDTTTWGAPIAEQQTMKVTGAVSTTTGTDTLNFLGHTFTVDNSGGNFDTAAKVIAHLADGGANETAIIDTWNGNNPKKEIASIVALDSNGNGTNDSLTITYKSTEGNVDIIEDTSSNGVIYADSVETVEGTAEDSLSYTLNNTYTITVTNGETLDWDINEDGNIDGGDIVNKDNAVRALVHKINQDNDLGNTITAYNGKYELDEDGNKILTTSTYSE